MKIAIVEDNAADRNILEELLQRFSVRENICMDIEVYTSGEDVLVEWPADFDVVFLDIHMDKLNGIEVAAKFRETNERVIIIFITNSAQHSLMGYSVDALDYLIKPVTKELLDRAMVKALRRMDSTEQKCITIRNNDGFFVIHPKDIHYIELQNRKTVIHTKTGEVACLKTIQYMEEQLPNTFFRCHSAFLINLNSVESVKGPCAMVAGNMIPISKHRRREFLSLLTAFVGEKL